LYFSKIAGTGSYLPEKRMTNHDLEKIVETSHDWIIERTGIVERRIAGPSEATSDLGLKAAGRALEMANMSAKDIDSIIFATVSPDQPIPSTACFLQNSLGARPIMAFDLVAACSGFVYGLSLTDQMIKTGMIKTGLVVGAEVLSRIVNYEDRDTCILFGDGAGAAIVTRAEEGEPSKILSHHIHSDGSLHHLFETIGGGTRKPLSPEVIENREHYMKMKGREIFKHAVRTLTQCCEEAIQANGFSGEDIDWLVPHQANIRILEAVAKSFSIPMEKVIVNIEKYGNTSAATVPIALDEAVRDGRIKRGQLVLLTAFGAGLTSGSSLLRF